MKEQALQILVVDDESEITSALEAALGPDHCVVLAQTIDEARRVLQDWRFDLLLCDWLLAGVASRPFLEEVAARQPSLHRILMTGSPPREWQQLVDRGVVSSTLIKPFLLGELWAVIDSVAGRR
jgi:DNA-binding NtrC family response regulator